METRLTICAALLITVFGDKSSVVRAHNVGALVAIKETIALSGFSGCRNDGMMRADVSGTDAPRVDCLGKRSISI